MLAISTSQFCLGDFLEVHGQYYVFVRNINQDFFAPGHSELFQIFSENLTTRCPLRAGGLRYSTVCIKAFKGKWHEMASSFASGTERKGLNFFFFIWPIIDRAKARFG